MQLTLPSPPNVVPSSANSAGSADGQQLIAVKRPAFGRKPKDMMYFEKCVLRIFFLRQAESAGAVLTGDDRIRRFVH
jgi:hypothetical protein